MSTINYRITLDLGSQMQLSAGINAALLPLVNQAVNGIAQATAANWREAVYRAKLWSGEKDAYAGSISFRMTGDFSAMVESDYKYAQDIEAGRPARDLKKMLDTSMKVRRTKDGSRFLIIPFRHNTPGNEAHGRAMSPGVYQQAKMLSLSSIVGHGWRPSGTGAWGLKTKAPVAVRQRKYNWGDRLFGDNVPKHQQGMVRMNTATGQGKKSSSYLTFRVMSDKSRGWIVAPQPGQHIARGVAQDMQPKAEMVIAEAIRRSFGG